MANDEHVALLKKGGDAWDKWRLENANIRPDLQVGGPRPQRGEPRPQPGGPQQGAPQEGAPQRGRF